MRVQVTGTPEDNVSRKDTAAALMQRIAARCIDQLIKHGYVQRRDLEDLRTISREYRAAMKENV